MAILIMATNRESDRSYRDSWACATYETTPLISLLQRFSNDCRKPNAKIISPTIHIGANSAMNQSNFVLLLIGWKTGTRLFSQSLRAQLQSFENYSITRGKSEIVCLPLQMRIRSIACWLRLIEIARCATKLWAGCFQILMKQMR